jgi:osmotically-inducible protein OsmY
MLSNPSPSGERLSYVRAQLLQAVGRDPMLTPSSLELTLDSDILRIGGMVPHGAAKKRISELAGKLAPELTIDNSCVIDAMAVPSDSELANRAGEWVQHTFGEDAGTMNVLIANGKAYLRGSWPNLAAITQAQEVIGQFPGIAVVDPSGVTLRHVTSLPGVGEVPLDGIDVLNELEEQLSQAGYRLGDWVNAQADHGRLTLIGVVDDEAARQKVLEIASRIKGVRRVDDRLILRSGAGSQDRMVEERIKHTWTKAKVSTPDLYLFVSGSQAFVGGTVDVPEAKQTALHLVHQAPAIRQVIEQIRIVTRRSRPA